MIRTTEVYRPRETLETDWQGIEKSGPLLPLHGVLGLIMVFSGWYLSWVRPVSLLFLWENAFFLLWLGYTLFIDGLNVWSKGHSLLTRNPLAFLGLFLASMACWWLFEFLNLFLQNWRYILNRPVSHLEYAIRATIHFSIVTPAVLETAELWSHSKILSFVRRRHPKPMSTNILTRNLLIGIVWLILVIGFPRYGFPLVWGAIFLIIDAVNYLNKLPSIHELWERGERRMIWSLSLGALTCGFFWEMWNYLAVPKWIYEIPFVDFYRLFEMPVLGYIGYLPFGLEVFALYFFVMHAFCLQKTKLWDSNRYVRL